MQPIEVPDFTIPPHLLVYPEPYTLAQSTDPEQFFVELLIIGDEANRVRCQLIFLVATINKDKSNVVPLSGCMEE